MARILAIFAFIFASCAAQAQGFMVPVSAVMCQSSAQTGCFAELAPSEVTVATLQAICRPRMGNAPMPHFPSNANQALAEMVAKIHNRAAARGMQATTLVQCQVDPGISTIAVMFVLKQGGMVEMDNNLATTFTRF